MKRLLWKELRENRIWALPLIASTVGMLFLHQGYTFFGDYATFSPLVGISAIVALLFGTSAYASELSGDKADFLYSRPVSWKRILLAKLTIGFSFIIGAAVLSAIVYRLICPSVYAPFATLPALVKGIGFAALLMGIPYILGIACSVVFPGFIGGILTLFMVLMLGGLEMLIINKTSWVPRIVGYIYGTCEVDAPFIAFISWPLAILVAGFITMRSGLTRSTGIRVRRYITALIIVAVLLIPADLFISCGTILPQLQNRGWVDEINVSPDGKYAYIPNDSTLIRLSDRKFVQFQGSNLNYGLGWYGEGKFYFISKDADRYYSPAKHRYIPTKSNSYITLMRMDREGKLHQKRIDLGYWEWIEAFPSPYSNLIALKVHALKSHQRSLLFVDTVRARKLPELITLNVNSQVWWKSKNELVRYTPIKRFGGEGKYHTIRVLN